MTNFSGGSYYMPLYAILAFCVSFPATLLIWTGMATSLGEEDGTLDYQRLRRRLNRVLLPICLGLFVLCALFLNSGLSTYDGIGDLLSYGPSLLWGAAVPTIGIYCSVSSSARLLNSTSNLSKRRWFLCTLLFIVLILVIGFIVFTILSAIGDSLHYTRL